MVEPESDLEKTLRIAVVYDCLFPWSTGGGERLYRVLAEEFAAAGHDVTYVTRQQWDGEPPDVEGFRVVVVSTDRDLYDEVGARVPAPALRFARGVFKHLRRHRHDYDIVFVSATPATNVPAVRAALAGTKVVVCVDWLEVWLSAQWRAYSGELAGRAASALQHLAIRLSTISTCHSQLIARRMEQFGAPTPPLVSPGLIHEQTTRTPSPTAAQPPRVIYIGRHIPDKRVDTLPAAIAYARTRIPDLTATIFGDGPARSKVLAEVERLSLTDVVSLPGFVSQDEIDEGLRTAACLVNPSGREGYGLVVVEACAVGTPVVLAAGQDNAAVELVEPGVNGTVAASTAPEVLGEAIVSVVGAGDALRASTLEWFADANETKTLRATATRIIAHLEGAARGRAAG